MTTKGQKAALPLRRRFHSSRLPVPQQRSRGFRYRVGRAAETGDTLIELIIAMVVIALASVALVGGIVGAITGSSQHRGLSTLDALLKSMAETAKVQIGGPGGQFNCAYYLAPAGTGVAESNTYQLLSEPNPSSGPAGTAVTVFATGMTASTNEFSVTMGGVPATNVSGSSDDLGNATVSFDVPAGLVAGQSYAIEVTSGTGANEVLADNTTSSFEVKAAPSPIGATPALSDYHIGLTQIGYWNANQFATATASTVATGADCASPSSAVQVLTLSGSAPSNVTDSLQVVVNGISGTLTAVPPTFTTVGNPSFIVGTTGSFNFTASGIPAPTFALLACSGAICASSTALPTGLSLNGAGLLYGDPPAPGGQATITVQASNGVNPAAVATFTLTIYQPPSFTSVNAAGFPIGTNSSFGITTEGYPTPTFQALGGTLPAGVSFGTSTSPPTPACVPAVNPPAGTAILCGTPAAGDTTTTYPLTFTITNCYPTQVNGPCVQNSVTQPFSLIVGSPPTFSGATSATFTVGTNTTGNPPQVTVTGLSSSSVPLTLTDPTISGPNGGTTLPSGVKFTASAPTPTTGLSTVTGAFSGTPTSGTGGQYTVTLTATDLVGSASETFTLNVDQAPAITTNPLATTFATNPTPGSPNGFTFAASGYPPPVFSTSNSSTSDTCSYPTPGTNTGLPTSAAAPAPQMALNPTTGLLSGTPASVTPTGTPDTFRIWACNGVGTNVHATFQLTVVQAPAFTSGNAAIFTAGQSEVNCTTNCFLVTASGTNPTITESGTLPSGVYFGPNNCHNNQLCGDPAIGTGGIYPITFTATVNGLNATQNFTLTVDQAPAFSPTTVNLGVTAGQPFTYSPVVTGYPPPTVTATIPAPLSATVQYNATTNVLSGTSSAPNGTYTITFSALNCYPGAPFSPPYTSCPVANQHTATQTLTLVIGTPPTAFSTGSSATFTIGASVSCVNPTSNCFQVSADGSPAPTYSTSSTLPSGVTLSSTGVLSGTPAPFTNGLYNLQITATNVVGTIIQHFTLSVVQTTTAFSITESPSSVSYGSSSILSESGLPQTALSSGAVTFTYTKFGQPQTVCTFQLSQTADSCPSSTTLSVGTYTVTASYAGNGTYTSSNSTNCSPAPCTGSASVVLTVTAASTSFTISVNGNAPPASVSKNTNFTLTEAGLPGDATGSISFSGVTIVGCTLNLPTNSCNHAQVATTQTYSVTATFNPSVGSNYSESTFMFQLTVTTPTSFTIKVGGSTTSVAINFGSVTTLSESGLPTGATGSVTFTSGSSSGSQTLCSFSYPAATSCSTLSTLPVAAYTGITAFFADTDGAYSSSTSTNASPPALYVLGEKLVQQQVASASSVIQTSVTLTNPVANGDTLILSVALDDAGCTDGYSHGSFVDNCATVSSVTESNVTGWTQAVGSGSSNGGTTEGDAEIWYAVGVPSNAGQKITINLTYSTDVDIASVSEWSGVAGVDANGASNSAANGYSKPINAGNVTPTGYYELLISAAYAAGGNATTPTPSPSTGFTEFSQSMISGNYKGYAAYEANDPSESQTSNQWTQPSTSNWASATAAFTL